MDPTGIVRCGARGPWIGRSESMASSQSLRRVPCVNRKGSAGERGTITLTGGASSSAASSSRGITAPK